MVNIGTLLLCCSTIFLSAYSIFSFTLTRLVSILSEWSERWANRAFISFVTIVTCAERTSFGLIPLDVSWITNELIISDVRFALRSISTANCRLVASVIPPVWLVYRATAPLKWIAKQRTVFSLVLWHCWILVSRSTSLLVDSAGLSLAITFRIESMSVRFSSSSWLPSSCSWPTFSAFFN